MTSSTETPTRTQAGVAVTYNGRTVSVHYRREETVRLLLKAALRHFGIVGHGKELALFTTAGTELSIEETLVLAGVIPGEELVLRPRIVRGGR